MTKEQRAQVEKLRLEGFGYKKISDQLSLPRDTVRSFCVRNHIRAGAETMTGTKTLVETDIQASSTIKAEMKPVNRDSTSGTKTGNPSKIKIGNTVFIITTGYSETASETLEKKLEKLILNEAARQANNYLCA